MVASLVLWVWLTLVSRYDFDCLTQDQIWQVLTREVTELSSLLTVDVSTARTMLNHTNWNSAVVIKR